MARAKYTIEKFTGKAGKSKGQFFYRIKGGNGENMAPSEAIENRGVRNRIVDKLAASFKDGHVKVVDLDPPAAPAPLKLAKKGDFDGPGAAPLPKGKKAKPAKAGKKAAAAKKPKLDTRPKAKPKAKPKAAARKGGKKAAAETTEPAGAAAPGAAPVEYVPPTPSSL